MLYNISGTSINGCVENLVTFVCVLEVEFIVWVIEHVMYQRNVL